MMKNLILRICVGIGCFWGLSNNTLAQSNIDPLSRKSAFLAFIQTQNIQFKIPRRYKELASYTEFECGDAKFTSSLMYPLSNEDTSVVIAFSIYYPESKESLKRIHEVNPQYNPDSSWIGTTAYLSDTTKSPLIFFPTRYLRKFNADNGSQFTRNCNLPFLNKLFENRIIFLDKKREATWQSFTYSIRAKKQQ